MNTEYPIFDPLNPEAFEPLSYGDVCKLKEEDSAAHNEYGIQKQAWDIWKSEMRKLEVQKPNPVASEKDEYGNRRAKKEIELMTKLGNAIEREGFNVKWFTGQYDRDTECHKTWAQYAEIWKDSQKVGDFRVWRPTASYSWTPVGWVIRTNRGVGNTNARYGLSRQEKRLKKLESAVTYIVETAVPKQDFEKEIKAYRKEIETLRIKANNLHTEISNLERGMTNYRSPDELLPLLLKLQAAGEMDKVEAALQDRNSAIGRLMMQRDEYLSELKAIEDVNLNPLLERAREVLPEFYE